MPRSPDVPALRSADREDGAPLFYRAAHLTVLPRVPASLVGSDGAATRAADDDDPTIEISFSSEDPVERWDWATGKSYDEVLSHARGDVDLSYAADGLPCLRNHNRWDPDCHIGIIEDVRIEDGKGRGRVRFSKNANGRAALQDVRDGILKKVSVGYDFPAEQYDQSEQEGRTVRRYRGWRPLEGSMVPIPADYTVGVGRSARLGAQRPETSPGAARKAEERSMDAPVSTAAPAAAPAAMAGMPSEHREIAALATQHKMEDRLAGWISASRTLVEVREEILRTYREKAERTITRGGGDGGLTLTDREEKSYSIVRAIQGAMSGKRSGFEFEVSDELEKQLGRSRTHANSFLMPTSIRNWLSPEYMARAEAHGRTLAVSASASGQELKFTEYGGFIGLLRNRARVFALGGKLLSGLQGDIGFVGQTSAGTFAWGAETGTTSASNFGTTLRTMSPKNGSALTKYTRQMLAQSVESIEQLVRDDLAQIVALGIDAAAINGSGATNNPRGILNTTGIGAVTMGANGGVITFPKLVDLETEITQDNADVSAMAYLTTPGVAGKAKQTQQFSGTNGVPIWTGTVQDGLLNGYRAQVSGQVPSTLTKGTSTGVCHAVVFGAWDQLLVGEWGAGEVIVDPYSAAPQIVNISTLVLVDVFLRHVESFAAIPDVTLS